MVHEEKQMEDFLSYEEAKMYHESCTIEKLESRIAYFSMVQKKPLKFTIIEFVIL